VTSDSSSRAFAAPDVGSLIFKYGVYLPVVALRGERVFHHLRELEESQWSPPERIRALQEEKLAALLQYSAANVPFYRGRFAEYRANGGPLQMLSRLPLTTKHDLIHSNQLLQSERYRGPTTRKTTGGSTGQAVSVRKSRRATALEQAANWRGFRWAGIDIGHRQGRFWGMPPTRARRVRARVIDWLAHRRRCSAFQFSADDMARYLRQMRRFRPHYLYGYVSMLRCLAEYLIETKQSFPSELNAVVSTSEPLTTPDRRLFERAFASPVFNEYGCGELGTIAHECQHGRLHIHAENLLVEVLSPEGSSSETPGEIVVTELNNLAMPLIRYRLSDFAALSHEPCLCGRTLPTLSNVFGRSYDMIANREGQHLHGEFFMYIFEDARERGLGVDAFQVVQHDFEHVTVRIVPSAAYASSSETFIRERIKAGLGSQVEVSFECVPTIPREKSGKLRLVIGMSSGS
jgi:phenylacetate-CoA ligase